MRARARRERTAGRGDETADTRNRGAGTAAARIAARRSREAGAAVAGNRARAASARGRRRHWHPAVPVGRAAVPTARCLAGGGSC